MPASSKMAAVSASYAVSIAHLSPRALAAWRSWIVTRRCVSLMALPLVISRHPAVSPDFHDRGTPNPICRAWASAILCGVGLISRRGGRWVRTVVASLVGPEALGTCRDELNPRWPHACSAADPARAADG